MKLKMQYTIPDLNIEQGKVKNVNQSMPITQKVKVSQGGTKLKG